VHAIGGRTLSKERKATISLAVHWSFSTLTSALYGATVARFPQARFANGAGFGLIVWAGLHEITLPLLGATPALRELPAKEQLNEFVTHSLFGATVEAIRATTLRIIDSESERTTP
jgi:uncharacterized membrane protein YagU involved in acid resistance